MTQPPPTGSAPGASSETTGTEGPDLDSPGAAGRAQPGMTPPPGTNQARTEPVGDSDSPDSPDSPDRLDPTGAISSADPQSPSAARITAEPGLAAAGGLAASGQRAGVGAPQGVQVPHTDAAPGTSEQFTGVGEVGSVTRIEPGHQQGGTGSQPIVGAHRPHAPDGEASPT